MAAKPTYKEVKAQAAKLLAHAEELRKEEMETVAKEVVASLNEYEISLSDLKAAGYAFADEGPKFAKPKKAAASSPVAKYRDTKNAANEWSGRGRPPKWMQAYMQAGKEKEEFLIR